MLLPFSKPSAATALLVVLLGISLVGCVSNPKVASLKDGACKAFDRPSTVIKGKTFRDQDWIDDQVEAGVGACQWQRPAPRPASWDAVTVAGKTVPVPPPPAKKQRLRDRLRGWLAR